MVEKISYVCGNVQVKFSRQLFQLRRGLPQGLSISSVLSSLYYASIELRATENLEALMS